MANVAHSGLTGSNLHENKGVSSATDNTVATAVSGATVWAKLTASNLTGTGNSFGAQLLHVRDQRVANTAGGSLTASGWRTHTLQTSVTNEITSASLASNQISLPSGTYYASGWLRRSTGDTTYVIRLYNVTDSSTLVDGGAFKQNRGGTADDSTIINPTLIEGRFTLSGTKLVEFQVYPATTTTPAAINLGSAPEIYADLRIWKTA